MTNSQQSPSPEELALIEAGYAEHSKKQAEGLGAVFVEAFGGPAGFASMAQDMGNQVRATMSPEGISRIDAINARLTELRASGVNFTESDEAKQLMTTLMTDPEYSAAMEKVANDLFGGAEIFAEPPPTDSIEGGPK